MSATAETTGARDAIAKQAEHLRKQGETVEKAKQIAIKSALAFDRANPNRK